MKKIITSLIILSTISLLSGDKPIQPNQWRKRFNKIDHEKLTKELGYNPNLRLIQKDDTNLVNQGGPTLYIHGWLSSPDALAVLNRCNDNNKIPGDVIVFDFPDAIKWIKHIVPCSIPLGKSNFAQKDDVKALLAVIKALHEVGIHCPIIYSHSRGGAVVMKAVGILNNSDKKGSEILHDLHFNNQDTKTILKQLKVVYFNTPVKDTHLLIQKKCEAKLALLTWLFPSLNHFASTTIPDFIEKKIFPNITSFDPNDTESAISYFENWNDLSVTAVLHFQHEDTHVPCCDNVDCAQKLLKANPDNTYIITGNDGGHTAGDKTLSLIIHALNKSNGLSHLANEYLLRKGRAILAKNKPTYKTVNKHLDDASKKHTREDALKKIILYKKISLYSSAACCIAFLLHLYPTTG
jgi:hypothetical protein